jgi:hypothetical protein
MRKKYEVTEDPVMCPAAMAEDADISLSTWYRHYRKRLPIIKISPKRIGCRQSAWRAALEAEAERAA